jgi:hypothetical protein
MAPQVAPDSSQGIYEGGFLLDVPAGLSNRDGYRMQYLGHQHHEAEQAEETGCGSLNRFV